MIETTERQAIHTGMYLQLWVQLQMTRQRYQELATEVAQLEREAATLYRLLPQEYQQVVQPPTQTHALSAAPSEPAQPAVSEPTQIIGKALPPEPPPAQEPSSAPFQPGQRVRVRSTGAVAIVTDVYPGENQQCRNVCLREPTGGLLGWFHADEVAPEFAVGDRVLVRGQIMEVAGTVARGVHVHFPDSDLVYLIPFSELTLVPKVNS